MEDLMLAINGGDPVRKDGWPKWPQYTKATEFQLRDVLASGRWAISGPSVGSTPKEREFAEAFARFNGASYCVPTDHGSSALAIALQALGIGVGDEVIVPIMTWVATATAVLNVNAVPKFVDVETDTGCISPEAIRAAVTIRTKAIIPVHLHCTMAAMDSIMSIATENNLRVLEDCAQAHGACWKGKYAGTLGSAGAFSMQQGKVLTCGEGGAVITDDPLIYDRLQQLRADSRRYSREEQPKPGEMYLWDAGEIMGSNYCLSEFHAAILMDQLTRLEAQNRHREANAVYLDERLKAIEGIKPIRRPTQLEKQTLYEYAVRCSSEAFTHKPIDEICRALQAELGFPIYRTDRPLYENPLYCPATNNRYHLSAEYLAAIIPAKEQFPVARELHAELIVFPHRILLGNRADMDDIVQAFQKVQTHAHELT